MRLKSKSVVGSATDEAARTSIAPSARTTVQVLHRSPFAPRPDATGLLRSLIPMPRTHAQLTAHIRIPTRPLQFFINSVHAINNRRTGVAVDLGCGGGRDSATLKARGYAPVHAIDRDPHVDAALQDLRLRADETVRVHIGHLELAGLAAESVDLVNAQHALPYFGRALRSTLEHVHDVLRPGGILATSFFGPLMSGMPGPKFERHSEMQVRAMLEDADLEVLVVHRVREVDHAVVRSVVVRSWDELIVIARRR